MFYLDTQRTVTRRESSLITTRRLSHDVDFDVLSSLRGPPSATQLGDSPDSRPFGSVRKEIVTLLFESMLEYIVESWEVIKPEVVQQIVKSPSEITVTAAGKKKRKDTVQKPSRTRTQKSRSKLDLADSAQSGERIIWWCAPDEKAKIRFKNGNIYEGNLSMKTMHGEGRYQWANGTVYLGDFVYNEIKGSGQLRWKDDTWYQGQFIGNVRHGRGLYVDSRKQRCYTGGWHCGTKHGQGGMFFSGDFKNSYVGDWVYGLFGTNIKLGEEQRLHLVFIKATNKVKSTRTRSQNVRHGFGTREYSRISGYQGEWDQFVREGRGLMIWPNHDYYKGEWKNGQMSGCGLYIWGANHNDTMALPSIISYRGFWQKGVRHGYGLINYGLGMTYYKGEFLDGCKHGSGKLVTYNGLIIQDKKLFSEDKIKPDNPTVNVPELVQYQKLGKGQINPEFTFDIYNSAVGLRFHIEAALKNLDRTHEKRLVIINEFLDHNRAYQPEYSVVSSMKIERASQGVCDEMIEFEELTLLKALQCYENDLNDIYYKYATLGTSEPIFFTPILIRLFLWQFYYDCNLHQKGFTFVQLDDMIASNENWLTRSAHNPFERIHHCQFLHTILTISNYLYAKRCMPGPRPETIVAQAFREFMDNDALPNVGSFKGTLSQEFGSYIPFKSLYELYKSLGEPHTVLTFLRAVRRPSHLYMVMPQPELVETPEECLPWGYNAYIFSDDMTFIKTEQASLHCIDSEAPPSGLPLFNFGNLSSRAILRIFARIFPQLCEVTDDHFKVMDLGIELTFFEFFLAFVACGEESIRVKDEEMRWRELFEQDEVVPIQAMQPSKSSPVSHR